MTTGYSGKHASYYIPPLTLADKIADAIAAIPASNPGYISVRQETLGDLLSREVILKIAQVAAATAKPEG